MRFFLFADIHSNKEALDTVLEFAAKQDIDHYLFLGDIVGYGASPNEVLEQINSLDPITMIRGNHDKAACNKNPVKSFNPIAADAILWTRTSLNKKNRAFLKELKKGPIVVDKLLTVCHGAPFEEDFYIFGEFDAAEAFLHFKTNICFFGHTHFPYVYTEKNHIVEGSHISGDTRTISLKKGTRYLINPGSVGQPRDRNNKTSCAVYDTDKNKITFFRIKYNIETAQRKILNAGLPEALAHRLSIGI